MELFNDSKLASNKKKWKQKRKNIPNLKSNNVENWKITENYIRDKNARLVGITNKAFY